MRGLRAHRRRPRACPVADELHRQFIKPDQRVATIANTDFGLVVIPGVGGPKEEKVEVRRAVPGDGEDPIDATCVH